VVLNEQAMKT